MVSAAKVTLAGEERTLAPVTGRKFYLLGKVIREITRSTPDVFKAIGEFRADYERENHIELTRAQALARYPATPAVGQDGQVQTDDQGEPVMIPSPLGHLTDADWQASGNVLRIPQSPSPLQEIAAAFPVAFDAASDQVIRLLAIMITENAKVADAAREGGSAAVDQLLEEEGNRLLDTATFDELMELLVVAGENIQELYAAKAEKLGDRLGKLLATFGLAMPGEAPATEESQESSTSTPTSSTESPEPTDGAPAPSSTAPTGAFSTPAATG